MTERHAIVRVDCEPPELIARDIENRRKASDKAERRAEQSPPARYEAVPHSVLRSVYERDDLAVVDRTEDTDE